MRSIPGTITYKGTRVMDTQFAKNVAVACEEQIKQAQFVPLGVDVFTMKSW